MQIFKKHKTRIASLVSLIAMLAFAGHIVGIFLRPISLEIDSYNAEYNILKKNKPEVDMIFTGASRPLVTFNPKIFEKKMDLGYVFNLSTSTLGMQGIYFQLKDFFDDFHPKTVVIGITYQGLIEKEVPKRLKLRLLERLHGFNRLAYIKDCFLISEYPLICPIYGYRDKLFNIRENMEYRAQFQKEGIYMKTSNSQYVGQGFIVHLKSVPLGNMGIRKKKVFEKAMVQKNTIYYLDKCVQLCKDNHAQLVFVTPPTSMANIYEINNYQNLIDFIADYTKKNHIIYHNLNYLKGREEWLHDSMMFDYNHVCKTGSEIVSEKYAEILSKSLNNIDTSKYFYSSLMEMQKSVNRIVAVDSKPSIKNNVMSLNIKSLQNKEVTPHYQILLARKDNDFKTIIDWTSKSRVSFKVPKGHQYHVLLRARYTESDPYYAWMAWEVDKNGKIRKVQDVKLSNL